MWIDFKWPLQVVAKGDGSQEPVLLEVDVRVDVEVACEVEEDGAKTYGIETLMVNQQEVDQSLFGDRWAALEAEITERVYR